MREVERMEAGTITNRQSIIQIVRAASSDIIGILSGDTFSFALSLMLLHTTHSAISFGLEMVVYPIIGLLLVVPISNFVDTHAHKPMILVSKLVTLGALIGYSLVIFHLADRLVASILIIAVFGINDKLTTTAYTASVHELVNDEHIKPLATIEQAAGAAIQLASPLMAAMLYSWLGFRGVLVIEMVAEAAVILITLSMQFHPQPRPQVAGPQPSQLRQFRRGLDYIRQHPVLLFVVQLAVCLNLLFSSINVGLSYVMIQTLKLGNLRLGWVSSGFALGMLVGNLVLLKLPDFKDLIRTVLRLTFGLAGCFIVMGLLLLPSLGANLLTGGLMLCAGADGLFLAGINTPMGVYMQSTVPTEMLGRVSGTMTTLTTVAMPVGTLLFSWLFGFVPGSWLFLATGVVLIGVVGLFARRPHPVATTRPVTPKSQRLD